MLLDVCATQQLAGRELPTYPFRRYSNLMFVLYWFFKYITSKRCCVVFPSAQHLFNLKSKKGSVFSMNVIGRAERILIILCLISRKPGTSLSDLVNVFEGLSIKAIKKDLKLIKKYKLIKFCKSLRGYVFNKNLNKYWLIVIHVIQYKKTHNGTWRKKWKKYDYH